jgi:hypothetical protein
MCLDFDIVRCIVLDAADVRHASGKPSANPWQEEQSKVLRAP